MTRPSRFRSVAILPFLLWAALRASAPAWAGVASDVADVLGDKGLAHAQAGVQLVQLGDTAAASRVIYHHDADMPLMPASNLKLLTTSAALDRLGPDFKFRTQLLYHNGDLVLIGDGDPAFGDAELLTRSNWDVTTAYKQWAGQLKAMRVASVRNVIVDDGIFDEVGFHPRWPADQRLNRYEAEVGGMNLNANCLDVFYRPTSPGQLVAFQLNPPTQYAPVHDECRTGPGKVELTRLPLENEVTMKGRAAVANSSPLSITVHDSSLYAATVLAETVSAAGIPRTGDVRRDRTQRDAYALAVSAHDASWQVVAVNETPLVQVMARANKDSMNLYAECICKRLGAEAAGSSGSWANGTAAVNAFLAKLGIPPGQFRLDDGCGLSKENRVTASAFTEVLRYDYFSANAKTFLSTLPVAGVDGTLLDRFPHSAVRGRVLAKTGHVNGVSCLSGYLHARDDRWYAFSILLHNAVNGNAIQERIVEALDANVPARGTR